MPERETERPLVFGFIYQIEPGPYFRTRAIDAMTGEVVAEAKSSQWGYARGDLADKVWRWMPEGFSFADDFQWIDNPLGHQGALMACLAACERRTADAARALLGEEVEV
jgi:hypothetical protein